MAKRIIQRNSATGRIVRIDNSPGQQNQPRVTDPAGNSEGNDSPVSGVQFDASKPATGDSRQVFVDPAQAAGGSDPDSNDPGRASSSRAPGRPRGSSSGGTKKTVQGSLTGLLYSLHQMGSVLLKTPELELTEGEAKRLGDAAQAVMSFYTDAEIPEEVMLWSNLIMAAGAVYGPRVIAYKIRNARNVTPKLVTQVPASNVQPIRPMDPAKQNPKPQAQPQPQAPSISLQEWSAWNGQSAAINSFE